MRVILITGNKGFIGKNLCIALKRCGDIKLLTYDIDNSPDDLEEYLIKADIVIHLAGTNRPLDQNDFESSNILLTHHICNTLAKHGKRIPIVFSSSIQAELDNPYGRSKYSAESVLINYNQIMKAPVYIYRLPNVFGKWSRPNYNSVVATFCYNVSHGLPVIISNRDDIIHFAYIDDIVSTFIGIASSDKHIIEKTYYFIPKIYTISLGKLYDLIIEFQINRHRGLMPDFGDPLIRYLYSSYLSFLDTTDFAYPVNCKADVRGWLFELIKSPRFGQIFVSSTKPGITRGNHYHDTKIEKFCVVKGQAIIRFRSVLGDDIIKIPVDDKVIQIVDIPPGYTHSIENTGEHELITIFWANEIFNASNSDTWQENVIS